MIEVNESNTQDVNRPFPNLIPTETLVFSLYLSKFANSLFTNLKSRIFVIVINHCQINYCRTFFDPQNTIQSQK